MKRRAFWKFLPAFLLPAAARAQQWREPIVQDHVFTGEYKKVLNNQCPVCGTMAPAVHDQEDPAFGGNLPNLARCVRCNCAFYQDPE